MVHIRDFSHQRRPRDPWGGLLLRLLPLVMVFSLASGCGRSDDSSTEASADTARPDRTEVDQIVSPPSEETVAPDTEDTKDAVPVSERPMGAEEEMLEVVSRIDELFQAYQATTTQIVASDPAIQDKYAEVAAKQREYQEQLAATPEMQKRLRESGALEEAYGELVTRRMALVDQHMSEPVEGYDELVAELVAEAQAVSVKLSAARVPDAETEAAIAAAHPSLQALDAEVEALNEQIMSMVESVPEVASLSEAYAAAIRRKRELMAMGVAEPAPISRSEISSQARISETQ